MDQLDVYALDLLQKETSNTQVLTKNISNDFE